MEGGEWKVLQGMARVLAEARDDVEIVVELSPKWLALHAASATSVVQHMRARGFHAYTLHSEDYEVARCHDAEPAAAREAPGRPRRLREVDVARLDAGGTQVDVIFSRTDAEWL